LFLGSFTPQYRLIAALHPAMKYSIAEVTAAEKANIMIG
jgi:hypothetical protein